MKWFNKPSYDDLEKQLSDSHVATLCWIVVSVMGWGMAIFMFYHAMRK